MLFVTFPTLFLFLVVVTCNISYVLMLLSADDTFIHTHTHTEKYIYIYIYHHHHVGPLARIYLTLSRHFSPNVHRLRQVFRTTSRILTKLLYVCMFELVFLFLLGHMWGSIGVHHLWARPCFSSSVLHVWFIYFGQFSWWEAGGRIVGALLGVAARTCSILLATFLCN